ncbi:MULTISPECIES: murein hydrolase activator EnvC family protein [Marinomonas]|uniref:Peptidoglycan DD-metalloendopeptidase family protein n=1 Tax=Marinomonas arctica TaxID=383750 RepID=A0A7H1J581_9GAMM|nr:MULTISPECIES: peptidoglycan DD-metalloendopeptidase family protein [Marinomonas]MCS7486351.1 peptidase M23 [Marinomonas sp. BSi20414]QNT05647.1 peptidoglycan DD-metalloendopeptidase family protein [Marinomonas arctica]GGN29674.1 peptidase M23 [Marinomonas arctica]
MVLLFRSLLLCLCLLPSLGWTAGEPQTPEEAKQQIQALQKDLQKLNSWLKDLKSERSDVEKQLEGKEKDIQALLKKIQEIQESLKKGDEQLGELRVQQRSLQLSIQQQNEQIAAQLRAVYRSGNEESIKLLLNGNTSEEAQRLVQYNRYFSTARQSLINGFVNEVNDLSLVENSIRSHRAQQAKEESQLKEERSRLLSQQTERRNLLVKLDQDLAQGDKRSKQLLQDQQNLQDMLQRLEEALADVKIPDQDVPFSSQRGKLVRPLKTLATLPTTGSINLGGVTLRAKEGEPVHAIFSGRVVFSDWMRGFGFLLILDHGDGYMSLYGYNQSLLKEVGEWVGANDTVAMAGSTGGRPDAALFFAIRHNGTPLKPLSWIDAG